LNGGLYLRAGVRGGRTVLLESRGTYPLQVVRPHVESGRGGLSLCLLQLSGGLLDGDRVSIEVVVEQGARLALRTQAATQVHAGRSAQALYASVDDGGWFSYVPQALVPHAMAEHHARTQLDLGRGAHGLIAEALTPGRLRFGEAFAYRQVRLDLDARRAGVLVARERAVIRPEIDPPCARFGRFTHVASAYFLGGTAAPNVSDTGGILVGRTELAAGGWLVRVVADRAAAIDCLLRRLSTEWWFQQNDQAT
jgi:urease accessory protein UreH